MNYYLALTTLVWYVSKPRSKINHFSKRGPTCKEVTGIYWLPARWASGFSGVTTHRIIHVYGFLAVTMLLMYSVLHCLDYVGNKITTTKWTRLNLKLEQSGRSPKVVARFSATNFSSYIIKLLQLHDKIQIEWNYAWIHYNIAIRRHLML